VTGFTTRFSAQIDSKGRITIPARIRNRLNLEKGEKVSLTLESGKVVSKEFESEKEALEFLSRLEGIERFSFDGDILEVVLSE